MSKAKFNKITKLKNPESFLQVNLIRGFKYIDRAGGIINLYHLEDNAPAGLSLDLNGLVLEKPTKDIDIMKVTSKVFWAKYTNVHALETVAHNFVSNMGKVLKELEVTEVSRIGWRNHFVYEFTENLNVNDFFKNLSTLKKSQLSAVIVTLEESGIKANMAIQKVVKVNDSSTFGVLFDVDTFIEGTFEVNEIGGKFKELNDFIKSEIGVLGAINETFI